MIDFPSTYTFTPVYELLRCNHQGRSLATGLTVLFDHLVKLLLFVCVLKIAEVPSAAFRFHCNSYCLLRLEELVSESD